jgi:glutamyl-Q tRNA(Asp) synthetase
VRSRFAPSTTGEAHPGTLLSALLVWLDARKRGGRALLRLEDLDTTRVKTQWSQQLVDALLSLGIEFDETVIQSARTPAHEAALDRLAAAGRLYPCTCSRADRTGGRRAPDGGWAYANTCRGKPLPAGGWRAVASPGSPGARSAAEGGAELIDGNVRVQIPDDRIDLVDELGVDLSQTPATDMGDPVVRRRDGVIAYQLAVVVDDADSQITDVVRGHDIAPSTATQIMLQRLLGLPTPIYRHHFLLLEPSKDKLAKLHGSLPFSTVRERYVAAQTIGWLAHLAGLQERPEPRSAAELVPFFDWSRVRRTDVVLRWNDGFVIGEAC